MQYTSVSIPKPIVIEIHGAIGAGKSTLIEKISELIDAQNSDDIISYNVEHIKSKNLENTTYVENTADVENTANIENAVNTVNTTTNDTANKMKYKLYVVEEPVKKWKESGLLARFYEDKSRWGYHFQTMAFCDRINAFRAKYDEFVKNETGAIYDGTAGKQPLFILERSGLTDRLFMQLLYEGKFIDELEMKNYNTWASTWEYMIPAQPTLIIYLTPPVETCMNRLHERNRGEEIGVTIDYQQKLIDLHDNLFKNDTINVRGKNVPIMRIDSTINYRDDKEICAALFARIMTKIKYSAM